MQEEHLTEAETALESQRRNFIKKFAKYTVAGAGLSVLIQPTNSSADSSNANSHADHGQDQGGGNGQGNGGGNGYGNNR
ncbi:MAG: hypothetical protein ACI8ZB_003086 [Desulforhopalus sp.]|jgi:hypothetical protein